MCTVIPKREFENPLTTEKDMIVYKVGFKHRYYSGVKEIWAMKSRYESFLYIPGVLNTAEMTYGYDESWSDIEEEMYYYFLVDNDEGARFVIKGFHSLSTADAVRCDYALHSNMSFGKFTIPAGSKYHLNRAGNVVSNQIIFNKFL